MMGRTVLFASWPGGGGGVGARVAPKPIAARPLPPAPSLKGRGRSDGDFMTTVTEAPGTDPPVDQPDPAPPRSRLGRLVDLLLGKAVTMVLAALALAVAIATFCLLYTSSTMLGACGTSASSPASTLACLLYTSRCV